MLDGITVLNQTPIIEYSILFQIGITCAFAGFFGLIIAATNESKVGAVLFIILLLSGFGYSTFAKKYNKPSGRYTYEVTIDKTVKMTDFNDKYIILEQKGQIYKIKERE